SRPFPRARAVRPPARAGVLHGRTLPSAVRGRVEISRPVDLGPADEAGLYLAALEHAHEVDRPPAPGRPGDVGVVAHGVQELASGLVANEAKLEEADRLRRVRLFRDDERDQRKPHADGDTFAVADLARGLRD